MTDADRRALAAALRHGRTRYAFRPGWDSLGRRNYRWYPRPYDGCWPPELEVSVLGDDYRLLAFGINRMATDSVRHALSVLAFFGVYQPEMADGEGCCPPDGYCAWHREQLDLYSAAEVTP